jgi:hypothetical protein
MSVVTAVLSGGPRAAILAFGEDHDGYRHGGGDAWLRLTSAGAMSLNRAAAGAPFEAGGVVAGREDCAR